MRSNRAGASGQEVILGLVLWGNMIPNFQAIDIANEIQRIPA
jgi:hypothetical protein